MSRAGAMSELVGVPLEHTHCGTPWRFRGSIAQMSGKLGQEAETTVARYSCDSCAATLEITMSEPCLNTTT